MFLLINEVGPSIHRILVNINILGMVKIDF